MKYFSSSPNPDFQKSFREIIEFSLNQILTEQRHQRADLATIVRRINKLINDYNLQKEVDSYYDTSDNGTTSERSADTIRQPEELQTSDTEVSEGER